MKAEIIFFLCRNSISNINNPDFGRGFLCAKVSIGFPRIFGETPSATVSGFEGKVSGLIFFQDLYTYISYINKNNYAGKRIKQI